MLSSSQAKTPSEIPKPTRSAPPAQGPGDAAGRVGSAVRQEWTLGVGGYVSGVGALYHLRLFEK